MNLLDSIACFLSNSWIKNYFDPKKSYKVLRKTKTRTKLLIDGKAKWFPETDFINGHLAR